MNSNFVLHLSAPFRTVGLELILAELLIPSLSVLQDMSDQVLWAYLSFLHTSTGQAHSTACTAATDSAAVAAAQYCP